MRFADNKKTTEEYIKITAYSFDHNYRINDSAQTDGKDMYCMSCASWYVHESPVLQRRKRQEANTGVWLNNPLSIDVWAVCWEVSSNQRCSGEKCDRCQQGYMFITRLFIILQELNANSPSSLFSTDHFCPSPSTLSAFTHTRVSAFSLFLSHAETVSGTCCFHPVWCTKKDAIFRSQVALLLFFDTKII